mmetsp:Transcript_18652/g.48033  ORF Transcript_18652/g.48033 Transcript_18652/m.48033 type:complete len:205 (-) Transcript_18652:225-839(-)
MGRGNQRWSRRSSHGHALLKHAELTLLLCLHHLCGRCCGHGWQRLLRCWHSTRWRCRSVDCSCAINLSCGVNLKNVLVQGCLLKLFELPLQLVLVLTHPERVEWPRERISCLVLQFNLLLELVHRLLHSLHTHLLVEPLQLTLPRIDSIKGDLRDIHLLQRHALLLEGHLRRANLLHLRVDQLLALQGGQRSSLVLLLRVPLGL